MTSFMHKIVVIAGGTSGIGLAGATSTLPSTSFGEARESFCGIAESFCDERIAETQTARDVLGPAAIVPLIVPQPPAKIIADPPLAEPLAQGHVYIQYRAENLRIVPVFGPKAVEVSPRIGHIHVPFDDAPWHWADASGEQLIIVGLAAEPHKIQMILANANHQLLDQATVEFVIPERGTPKSAVMDLMKTS